MKLHSNHFLYYPVTSRVFKQIFHTYLYIIYTKQCLRLYIQFLCGLFCTLRLRDVSCSNKLYDAISQNNVTVRYTPVRALISRDLYVLGQKTRRHGSLK